MCIFIILWISWIFLFEQFLEFGSTNDHNKWYMSLVEQCWCSVLYSLGTKMQKNTFASCRSCGPEPMTHSSRLELVTWGMLESRSGRIFGCALTVHIQTVQRPGVYSAAYSTVHYYEPLKSFEIRVGHSPSFWPPLSRYCHDCASSNVKQYSLSRSCDVIVWENISPVPQDMNLALSDNNNLFMFFFKSMPSRLKIRRV